VPDIWRQPSGLISKSAVCLKRNVQEEFMPGNFNPTKSWAPITQWHDNHIPEE